MSAGSPQRPPGHGLGCHAGDPGPPQHPAGLVRFHGRARSRFDQELLRIVASRPDCPGRPRPDCLPISGRDRRPGTLDEFSAFRHGGNNLYVPLASTNAVPQRTAPQLGQSGDAPRPTAEPTVYTAGAGATNYSSASFDANAVAERPRPFRPPVWNKPQLMTGTANGFPTPQWALVTRNGRRLKAFSEPTAAPWPMEVRDQRQLRGGALRLCRLRHQRLARRHRGGLSRSGAATSASAKGPAPWADLTQLDPTARSAKGRRRCPDQLAQRGEQRTMPQLRDQCLHGRERQRLHPGGERRHLLFSAARS